MAPWGAGGLPVRARLERRVVLAILSWWCCSITIIFYNKWMMRSLSFSFPLSITAIYMAVKLPLGFAATRCGETDIDVSWRTTVRWIIPLALVTSVEIGLSMSAYLFVSVTRITLVKSSAPAWQLVWGLLLGTERASARLIGVVCLATGGLILATYARNPATNPARTEGIVLLVLATCLQGLRGCMVQLTLRPTPGWLDLRCSEPDSAADSATEPMAAPVAAERSSSVDVSHEELALIPLAAPGAARDNPPAHASSDCCAAYKAREGTVMKPRAGAFAGPLECQQIEPIALVYLMAPWTTLFSLVLMLALEGAKLRDALLAPRTADGGGAAGAHLGASTFALLFGAGSLVFCLVLIELKIVQLTSALTLSVAGALKECVTIIGGHALLHDRMSTYNAVGLCCTMLGVHLYRLDRTGRVH
ncbi:hypothetical protein KFE25_012863 [Diacronema lutheri]|uniref:Sugar phosphate transporter domain-containing protein n=1 Tax=Diacronema lutheri TaxID=2081491 RepID=A0A8J5X501_DIALT|nr:hypothetical protein KFE25_012863 [Diacronema lutheri]